MWRRYFAYGSCMSLQDLRRTEKKAQLVGVGRLYGFKLAFTRWSAGRGGGVADVIKGKPDDFVEGVIFAVPDWKALDIREGYPTCYKRKKIVVHDITNDETIDAITYVVTKKASVEYQPSYEYTSIIIEGATRLTEEYQRILFKNLDKPRCKVAPISRPSYTKRKTGTKPLAHPSFIPPYRTEWEEYGDIDEREQQAYNDEDLFGFDPDIELAKRLSWLDE